MLMQIKNRIKKIVLKIKFCQKFYNHGYLSVSPAVLIINFIFQRVFRLSANAKFSVHYTSIVLQANKIEYGNFTGKSFAVAQSLYLQGGNGINFGANVLIGPKVSIISANHDFNNKEEWKKDNPIIIGNNVWIGANVVIFPGVTIGDNVIVGANSVVSKSFESNVVICGNPAKIIKKID